MSPIEGHWVGVGGYGLAHFFQGPVSLMAAAQKAHQLAAEPVVGSGFLHSHLPLIGTLEFALPFGFGLWRRIGGGRGNLTMKDSSTVDASSTQPLINQIAIAGSDSLPRRSPPFTWIDWLLVLAIAGLSVQLLVMLLGPTIEAWRNRPRPGMQRPQQYVVEQGEGADAVAIPISYLLYLPPKYDATRKWPLVVFLHGSGSRGQDLNLVRRGGMPRHVDQGKQFDFILLSPQCPKDSGWIPELVVSLIEHVSSSLSVDRDRVYLTGYSMGGFGTWETACYDPTRFAAIAPVSGGGDVEQADHLKNMPIWAFHGGDDKTVPLDSSRAMVDAVRKSGGHVEFTIYPDQGHGIAGVTYQNPKLCEWLLAQRRKPPAIVNQPKQGH